MKKIKIIAFYSENEEVGPCYLSAKNKLRYIFDTLISNGRTIEVISLCNISNRIIRKHSACIGKNQSTIHYMTSFKKTNFLYKIFHYLFDWVNVFFFILNHVEKNDTIYVYHATKYFGLIGFVKFIKKTKMILEVEEIYGDVSNDNKLIKKELKFFKKADAFIFPTELLDEKINVNHLPSVIIYGTYSKEKQFKRIFDDDDIHVVYAGTFDPRKGGVAAAAAAEFLPSGYHLHILGFGNEEDTKNIKQFIEDISTKTECKITFNGLLKGDEYITFIQSCNIGLSTQNPDAQFNNTSFPSKILSYMSNGLSVVSVRIPAIERSCLSNYIVYYNDQNPKSIASAILKASISNENKKIIMELSDKFKCNIEMLLDKVEVMSGDSK